MSNEHDHPESRINSESRIPDTHATCRNVEDYWHYFEEVKRSFGDPLSYRDWVAFNENMDAIDAKHRG